MNPIYRPGARARGHEARQRETLTDEAGHGTYIARQEQQRLAALAEREHQQAEMLQALIAQCDPDGALRQAVEQTGATYTELAGELAGVRSRLERKQGERPTVREALLDQGVKINLYKNRVEELEAQVADAQVQHTAARLRLRSAVCSAVTQRHVAAQRLLKDEIPKRYRAELAAAEQEARQWGWLRRLIERGDVVPG